MDVKTTTAAPPHSPSTPAEISASLPPIKPIKTLLPPRAALLFWQHARKVVVFVVGVTVLLTGVALLVLPGPGWLIIFGGLGLLATEFAWARWILKRAGERFEQLKQAALSTWKNGTTAPPTDKAR